MSFYEDERIRNKNRHVQDPSYKIQASDGIGIDDIAGVLSRFFNVQREGDTFVVTEKATNVTKK